MQVHEGQPVHNLGLGTWTRKERKEQELYLSQCEYKTLLVAKWLLHTVQYPRAVLWLANLKV